MSVSACVRVCVKRKALYESLKKIHSGDVFKKIKHNDTKSLT